MSPRDLVYVGHMLDMARKAVGKVQGLPRDAYESDENLRLALIGVNSRYRPKWLRIGRSVGEQLTSVNHGIRAQAGKRGNE